MFTGCRVAIVGGDARQLEVIDMFSKWDATVLLVGYDQLDHAYSGVVKIEWSEDCLHQVDVLVLPAVSTNDDGYIETVFDSESILLSESHIKSLPSHAVVYTGLANPILRQWCEDHDVKCMEWFERDDVAIYNSIPTAEGAVMMAMQNTNFTIHDSNCLLIGFGRVGMTLARLLRSMGARVSVAVHRAEQSARAYESGYNPLDSGELIHVISEQDLIFNTVPSMMITSDLIVHLPHHAIIIDLASSPGGTDFRYADKRGIKAILAPSLPGIVAPRTAGRIIARTLQQLVAEQCSRTEGGK